MQSVHEALSKAATTVGQPEAAPWSEPGAALVEKTVEELTVRPETVPEAELPQWLKYAVVAAATAAATHFLPQLLA